MPDNILSIIADRTCAVVVSFNPTCAFEKNIRTLRAQVERIIIIDNGSDVDNLGPVERVASIKGIELIQMGRNLGIGRALNVGMDRAHKEGFQWAITLDQDSTPTERMVTKLLESTLATPNNLALVAPTLVDANTLIPLQGSKRPSVIEERAVRTFMTSGSLTSVAAWEAVGRFRDDFFIDFVDHEYCLRCRCYGWRLLQSESAVLIHRLGNLEVRRVMGLTIRTTHHSASRRYYATRNRITTWRIYKYHFPGWVSRDIWVMFTEVIAIMLLETDRLEKCKAIFRGCVDSIRRRMGELVT